MQANRKTPVQPSQQNRRNRHPRRKAGIEPQPLPHWSPNQLRHSAATEIGRQFGLEAAQVVLGHSRADVTQVYAERDFARAKEIMRRIG
jgi:site-specific recombinase XerC